MPILSILKDNEAKQRFKLFIQTFPKNPRLAQLFTQMGRSEELGTGIRNVYKYSKPYSGSDNIVFLEEDIFQVKIPLTDKVTDKVTDNQKKIIHLITKTNKVTTVELAEKVGISQRKIKENLRKLKGSRHIIRIGNEKNGHWEIG